MVGQENNVGEEDNFELYSSRIPSTFLGMVILMAKVPTTQQNKRK